MPQPELRCYHQRPADDFGYNSHRLSRWTSATGTASQGSGAGRAKGTNLVEEGRSMAGSPHPPDVQYPKKTGTPQKKDPIAYLPTW